MKLIFRQFRHEFKTKIGKLAQHYDFSTDPTHINKS